MVHMFMDHYIYTLWQTVSKYYLKFMCTHFSLLVVWVSLLLPFCLFPVTLFQGFNVKEQLHNICVYTADRDLRAFMVSKHVLKL